MYQVRFVEEGALPEGTEWAIARQAGRTFLFVKESAVTTSPDGCCDALSRAWKAWQAAEAQSKALTLSSFAAASNA